MNIPDTILDVQTLGLFRISVDGITVAPEWPDDAHKVLFCSLLSPLDLYCTWDRICRSMLGVPASRASRRRVEEKCLRSLNCFLIREFGFTPLVAGHQGISIDHQRLHIDAFEFYSTILEGLKLLSIANHTAALEKFDRANALYTGSYLPGIPGKIIASTRSELESLYRTAVMEAMALLHNPGAVKSKLKEGSHGIKDQDHRRKKFAGTCVNGQSGGLVIKPEEVRHEETVAHISVTTRM